MPDFRLLANSSVRNLTPYQPGKPIEELERELGIKSSIKLASNENPLGPSPKVMPAVQSVLAKAHLYPDGSCYELKQALANFLKVETNQLTMGNGSENILELIIKSYLHQGDEAIISQYAFLTIPILLSSYGVNTKVVPAINYSHDVYGMVKAITDKTRVIFLVNPNNPTGTYTNVTDFNYLLQHVPPHVVIVVDEAYNEYITKADYPQAQTYLKNHPNLIITRTFSKAYGLAAFRLGYALSSAAIADILNRSRLPFNVNSIATKAGIIALEDQEHVKRSLALNQAGKEQLEKGLRTLQLKFIPSLGNFITIDVNDASVVYQQLLFEGVIVRPLQAYDLPRHIRVTIGTEEQNQRFLKAITKVATSSVKNTKQEISVA